MNINQFGQAALVDSLFFIVIVSAICTGLFYFAINYGSSPNVLINSFYSSDFAMDALKVVTYVNVMRDGTPISPSDTYTTASFPEYDYLLALLKEDFAQTQGIGLQSKKAISNTLYSVLKPFDDSLDYVFYIAKEQTSVADAKYMAMIIAVHDPYAPPPESTGELLSDPPNRVFYDCTPIKKNILEEDFFPELGSVESAYGKITLLDSPYVIGLHTWVAKNAQVIEDVKNPESDFNCSILLTMQRDPTLDNP